jgi:Tripartite tricarboxylate transporter family receptor
VKNLVAIVVFALATATTAWAQKYPTRPVLMIVPYPPGGLTDAVGRVLAEGMQAPLGQNVVIENMGGANGAIGSARVARAAPDGQMVLLGIWNTQVSIAKLMKLDYDPVEDFAPIAFLTDAPMMLVVHKSVPVSSYKELVGWLRANPDKASSGSAGIGSPPHLLDELVRKQTNTRFETVHYRGAGPIMQDLLGGQIQMSFLNPATAASHVRSGAIQGARADQCPAPDYPARSANDGRGRISGGPGVFALVSALRPEGDAKGCREYPQQGGGGFPRQSESAGKTREPGDGNRHAREANSRIACRYSAGRNQEVVADYRSCGNQAAIAAEPLDGDELRGDELRSDELRSDELCSNENVET